MAVQNVQVIQPTKIKKGKKAKAGGGAMGRKLGLLAGAAVGAATGNPLAGASLGASLGGEIGGIVDPAQAGTADQNVSKGVTGQQASAQKSDATLQLEQSLQALQTQPPQVQAQHAPILGQAYLKSVALDNPAKTA